MAENGIKDLLSVTRRFIAETDRDLLVFSGSVEADLCDKFTREVLSFQNRKKKATLFLCTYGGDPHAAYRMTRVLRRCYPEDIRMLIGGYCKSAGTLVALAADSLGFSDVGELGPLDTQITQRDEVMQMESGLEVFSTLQYLTDHAFACFEKSMLSIIRKSGQTVSTRLASEIASKLATGLLKPITAQLDPNRIGIAWRGLEVTKTYGRQLANTKNLRTDPETVVEHLVDDYPTHAFVIDQQEAKTLFKNVDGFSKLECEVYEQLKSQLTHPSRDGLVVNFSAMLANLETTDAVNEPNTGKTSASNSGKSRSTDKRTAANRKPVAKSNPNESREGPVKFVSA